MELVECVCNSVTEHPVCVIMILYRCAIRLGWGWGVQDQAYSRLSTTHGHITDCKLDSVVYAGVCV